MSEPDLEPDVTYPDERASFGVLAWARRRDLSRRERILAARQRQFDRVIFKGEPPFRVWSNMVAGEKPLIIRRESRIVFVRPAALLTAATVLLGVASWRLGAVEGVAASFLLGLLGIAWFVVVGWFVLFWASWWVSFYVITQKRVIQIKGLISNVAVLPINKVTDIGLYRSFWGWLFNFGTLRLESPGQVQDLENLRFVSRATEVHAVLMSKIYED